MTGSHYKTLDDTIDKPTKDSLKCNWVPAEYPAVSTKVVNRRGIQTGCVLLIVVIVLVIGFVAGLAIGHFLWKPLPTGSKCDQGAAGIADKSSKVLLDIADSTASVTSDQVKSQVEVVELTGSGEDESIGSGMDSDYSVIQHEDVHKSGEMGFGEEELTSEVWVSTRDVEYYEETRLNLEGCNTVLVTVKTCRDFYIGLLTESGVTNRDMIEVVIGGSRDKHLVAIRGCHECYLPHNADAEFPPDQISPLTVCHQYRRFWIYWDDERVMVGRTLVPFEHVLMERPNPIGKLKPKILALNTGFWGKTGHFRITSTKTV